MNKKTILRKLNTLVVSGSILASPALFAGQSDDKRSHETSREGQATLHDQHMTGDSHDMSGKKQTAELIGSTVEDKDGNRIGSVSDVIVDARTNEAKFAVVDSGDWSDRKQSIIPVERLKSKDRSKGERESSSAISLASEKTLQLDIEEDEFAELADIELDGADLSNAIDESIDSLNEAFDDELDRNEIAGTNYRLASEFAGAATVASESYGSTEGRNRSDSNRNAGDQNRYDRDSSARETYSAKEDMRDRDSANTLGAGEERFDRDSSASDAYSKNDDMSRSGAYSQNVDGEALDDEERQVSAAVQDNPPKSGNHEVESNSGYSAVDESSDDGSTNEDNSEESWSAKQEWDSADQNVFSSMGTTDRFLGLSVQDRNGDSVGEISDALVHSESGRIAYAIIETDNWFDGRAAIVPVQSLKAEYGEGRESGDFIEHISISITEDEFEELATFSEDQDLNQFLSDNRSSIVSRFNVTESELPSATIGLVRASERNER